MKSTFKYIHIWAVITSCIAFSACDVLDVEPADQVNAGDAFKNKAGIEKGILGSYSELQELDYYGRAFLITSDLAADNLAHPSDATQANYAEIDNNTLLAENGVAEGIWNRCYSSINIANNVIVKVPGMTDMTDDEKGAALGELYFVRALSHFNLLNYFGAIPLKTTPTVGTDSLNTSRSTVAEVYKQIISDLTYAESHLSASASTKTRASKYGAKALLARVYLYEKDYENAYKKADEVIKNGGYALLANFSDVFAKDGSAETIFEIAFDKTDRNRIAEFNFPKALNGKGEVQPDPDLVSAFTSDDKRFETTIAYSGTYAYANKYNDLSLGDHNVIILRLSEMYLIRAEANAHLATGTIKDIQDDLNEIRNRAGLADTDAATKDDLLMAIEKERRLEFAFEGHRWFDLVRTGRAAEVLTNIKKTYQLLFPIPLSEINTNNKMIQNPGY